MLVYPCPGDIEVLYTCSSVSLGIDILTVCIGAETEVQAIKPTVPYINVVKDGS